MPERYSSTELIYVLDRVGFRKRLQRGSHVKFVDDHGRSVIIPANRKTLPVGTFRSILNQAGISVAEFKLRL
jgi:predicted RNA binding protein YcfA (HicA-like mRNA interferase family)